MGVDCVSYSIGHLSNAPIASLLGASGRSSCSGRMPVSKRCWTSDAMGFQSSVHSQALEGAVQTYGEEMRLLYSLGG